jgi:hypothetical protein
MKEYRIYNILMKVIVVGTLMLNLIHFPPYIIKNHVSLET